MSGLEYPPCAFCEETPTPNTSGIEPHQWREDMPFRLGYVCGCGDASTHPPLCLRRPNGLGYTFWVRVPSELQSTLTAQREAVRRIPMVWRRGARGLRLVEERTYGDYRWWAFDGIYL